MFCVKFREFAGRAISDSDDDTWNNMLEAAGRWMGDSNSTVRDLRKIYRYRVKGEPQK